MERRWVKLAVLKLEAVDFDDRAVATLGVELADTVVWPDDGVDTVEK